MKRLLVILPTIFFMFSNTFLAMESSAKGKEKVSGFEPILGTIKSWEPAEYMSSFQEVLRLYYPLNPPAKIWFGKWNEDSETRARYLESYIKSPDGRVELAADCNREETLLIEAARHDCPDAVRMLVAKAGADYINYQKPWFGGNTALHVAAILGHTRVVKALLKGASGRIDVDVANRNGETALQIAVAYGHNEIVRSLIDADANINKRREMAAGETALMVAASEGNIDALQALLKTRKADVSFQDGLGWTVLHWAAQHCPEERVAEVVHLIKEHEQREFSISRAFGKKPTIISVFDLCGEIDKATPLHYAAARGRVNAAKALLAAGVPREQFNKYHETPFMLACKKGNAEVIALLAPSTQSDELAPAAADK